MTAKHQSEYVPNAGDIFACWGHDLVSFGISLETASLFGPRHFRWAPAHVAIACPRFYPNHKTCYWWESTTLAKRPCLEAEAPVSGCQVHQITSRIQDYVSAGGRVAVYRLTEFDSLTPPEIHQLRMLMGMVIGDGQNTQKQPITYDTAGALCSGTRILKRFSLWRNQLDTLFCSELLAAVLQRLGRLCRENPSKFTPAGLMRRLVASGTYQHLTEFTCPEDWRLR